MVLVANESKVLTKGHDKVLDVMYDILLHDSLIHILDVSFSQFFHIDEVKHVRILKHHHCFASILWCRDGAIEIIRQCLLVLICLRLNELLQCSHRKMLFCTTMDVIKAFRHTFRHSQYERMMRKRNSKEVIYWKIRQV